MSMVDILKKSLAFGLGAASFSAERLKTFADEMVARGEMSSDEAKKLIDDISGQAEEQKKSIENWMREQASKMLQQAGAAEDSRVDRLERRLAALEKRVAELSEEIGDENVCSCNIPNDEGPSCNLEEDL